MHRDVSLRASRIISVVVVLVATIMPFLPSVAEATPLAEALLRLDRMKASQATGGTVCAKPATSLSSGSLIQITFPSSYTVNATNTNWPTAGNTAVVDPANGSTLSAAWPITGSQA